MIFDSQVLTPFGCQELTAFDSQVPTPYGDCQVVTFDSL